MIIGTNKTKYPTLKQEYSVQSDQQLYPQEVFPHKKKNVYCLVFAIIFLILALFGSVGLLFYSIKYSPSLLNTNSNISATPAQNSALAKLEDHTCRPESEYNNQLIPQNDVDAYSRDDFYVLNLTNRDIVTKLSKTETFYTELILWDENKDNTLVYSGRALVCVKDKNKLATVFFSTNNSSFKNPVRYKDPEKSISNILIQAIYVVPSDAIAKVDWNDKIQKNLQNIQLAQKRIFNGKSNIDYRIYPEVVNDKNLSKDFLSKIARGIVTKDNNNDVALQPVNFINSEVYNANKQAAYPNFYASSADLKKYDQISTLVYFEVSNNQKVTTRQNESGYAFITPALDNGNYFGIIGTNLTRDISQESAAYHEFMHTLGLPDEYAYKDGTLQRTPTHLFKGVKQAAATLMEDPSQFTLQRTYIDDQERYMMGIKD